LQEQQRIVARIEELSSLINEARTLRQEAAGETEALYLRQLAATMTASGGGWAKETVSDVVFTIDAGWSPQCDDIPANPGQWGVLKTTSVQWCQFWPQKNKVLPSTLQPIPDLAVKKGDVLVTRAGPRKRVGVVAAVRHDEPRLTISDKLIRLRPNPSKIEARFLELSLASPLSQDHLVQRKTGLADAQVNISQAILRATPIAYPSIPEQRQIVSKLDALQTQVNSLKRLHSETTSELDALLPAILDRAFSGELC
jgi:type I restriction enzyme S subunit